MKKDLLVKLGIILVVVVLAAWYAFFKHIDIVKTLSTGNLATKSGNPVASDSAIKLGLDLKGGVYVVLQAKQIEGTASVDGKPFKMDEAMTKLIEVMDRRINALGVTEPTVTKSGDDRLIIELPGAKDSQEAIDTIGKTALLEFKLAKDDGTLGETLMTGKDLVKSELTFDSFGRPQIAFELSPEGKKIFADITRQNVGKNLAITLDGIKQTEPKIQSEIPDGRGVITGQYSVDEAKKMVLLLNSGALPVRVEIMETRVIGPSLGEKSIEASKMAGVGALLLIAVFMILFYRLPGLIANVSLVIYAIIVLGVENFFDVTLTLPGIAAFILSMGMAVDANVIIFARMKEELKSGTSIMAALEAGFNKAFLAIFDSNVTTLIIAVVLFIMGTGPIKGFALILAIGILASMFTAITITKVLLKWFILQFNIQNTKFFGGR